MQPQTHPAQGPTMVKGARTAQFPLRRCHPFHRSMHADERSYRTTQCWLQNKKRAAAIRIAPLITPPPESFHPRGSKGNQAKLAHWLMELCGARVWASGLGMVNLAANWYDNKSSLGNGLSDTT